MNRKLLYVLMSAGHRHKFVRTNDEVHTCRVCGRAEEHNWVLEKTETVCRGCSVCGATEGHTFTDGICSVCGISQPVTLKGLSARVSIEVKNPPPARLVLSWTGYDGYVVGTEIISFSGTVKFYEVGYGGTYRELSQETFTGETTTPYRSWESSPLTNLLLPGSYKFDLNMQISISGNVQVFEREWEESYSVNQV